MIKTEKFELEQRYVVLKITDVIKYLPAEMVNNLDSISRRISNARRKHDGKADLLSIVIEHDWPEYPWVLAMLKSRCEDNNASQYAVTQVAELSRLSAIEQAATALIQCKGRYHAELNTKALAEALGIELPQVDDINVVDLNRPSAIELQDAEIGIPELVTELINPAPTEPLTRDQALAWLVENVKVWPTMLCTLNTPSGWEWVKHFGSAISMWSANDAGICKDDWLDERIKDFPTDTAPASNKPSLDVGLELINPSLASNSQ
ncbi:hypothetical protein [Janthinobacterium sp. B9-8]|uniref:hypothetical protein n=1 Tax=Janthinobacterium sp. B9-8 TaxID=1236179 RepID=UPI00069A237A|nr:hypothetical protein [Janthinobacterium sp. B9-8]AMC34791.1 hypothetical protein VN23_09300 [Janthinobacterium sp. B9-8]